MLVAPPAVLLELQTSIATQARRLSDTTGEVVVVPTIGADTLRMAALVAIQIAVGQVVLDGSKPLRVVMPKPQPGSIEVVMG